MGSSWRILGTVLGRLGGVLGTSWEVLGTSLGAFWGGLFGGRPGTAPRLQSRNIQKKTVNLGVLGAILGPCWGHVEGMLSHFAVSCGAAREGQENIRNICHLGAIFWPFWSHAGAIWWICWVILWCRVVCGVALCCEKRLTFINITMYVFRKENL